MVDWPMVRFCSGERSTFEATCPDGFRGKCVGFSNFVLFFDGCAVVHPFFVGLFP